MDVSVNPVARQFPWSIAGRGWTGQPGRQQPAGCAAGKKLSAGVVDRCLVIHPLGPLLLEISCLEEAVGCLEQLADVLFFQVSFLACQQCPVNVQRLAETDDG